MQNLLMHRSMRGLVVSALVFMFTLLIYVIGRNGLFHTEYLGYFLIAAILSLAATCTYLRRVIALHR